MICLPIQDTQFKRYTALAYLAPFLRNTPAIHSFSSPQQNISLESGRRIVWQWQTIACHVYTWLFKIGHRLSIYMTMYIYIYIYVQMFVYRRMCANTSTYKRAPLLPLEERMVNGVSSNPVTVPQAACMSCPLPFQNRRDAPTDAFRQKAALITQNGCLPLAIEHGTWKGTEKVLKPYLVKDRRWAYSPSEALPLGKMQSLFKKSNRTR